MAKVAAEFGSTENRYQILAKLAVGGMAEIFLARAASVAGVERCCVLKRILGERAGDAQFVQMFVDEARLASQLHHPNIASVYDIGVLGGSYFFTMEYVHGETVRSLLERADEMHRPLPLACVLTIIAGAAAGLHHAHERHANDGQPLGIVHRDVSPANLMVSFEGNVKLVDFGVAKADDGSVETQSGTVKGKISYLSPEQCRGERVDRRSDLFSLGIVMWEMLTGRRLYRRANDFENMTAIVTEPPPKPSSQRPDVPRAVDDIVLRLLAKSVTGRFQTAGEVVEAIEDASMRAGTILSTSAVSRLMRDLFGVRPEPWVGLESKAKPYQTVSITSRPLPKELDQAPVDVMELGLSSVFDLSVSNVPRDPDDLSLPNATLLDADDPSLPNATLLDADDPSLPNATLLDADPPSLPNATLLDAAPPSLPNATLLDAAPPSPPSTTLRGATHPAPPNATLLGVSAPPSSTATLSSAFPTPSNLRAHIGSPARFASASAESQAITEPPTSPSGPTPVPTSPNPVQNVPGFAPWNPAGTQAPEIGSPPSRAIWPLVMVIVVAAAIGVAVVWLSMRTDERPFTPTTSPAPAQVPAADAGTSDALDMPSAAPLGTAPVAGSIDAQDPPKSDEDEIVIEPADDAHAPPSDASLPGPADARRASRPAHAAPVAPRPKAPPPESNKATANRPW